MSILSSPFAHITAKFELEGKSYHVDHFQINFRQPIDFKGKPQHEVTGGQMSITLEQIGDQNLYEWGRKSTALKNGLIVFRSQDTKIIYRIKFENAYCIEMKRNTSEKEGAKIVLVIAPEKVSMNGFDHNNFWPK